MGVPRVPSSRPDCRPTGDADDALGTKLVACNGGQCRSRLGFRSFHGNPQEEAPEVGPQQLHYLLFVAPRLAVLCRCPMCLKDAPVWHWLWRTEKEINSEDAWDTTTLGVRGSR